MNVREGMQESGVRSQKDFRIQNSESRTPSLDLRAREMSNKLDVDGGALFFADWDRALFFHFEVDAETLQREISFELQLFDDKAWVSLVAFTQNHLRPAWGGRATAWMGYPVTDHPFLNVRTYVRHCGETGIHFIAEWVPNPFAAFIAPRLFGLPYRLGRLNYRHDHECNELSGEVLGDGRFRYHARIPVGARYDVCAPGSFDESMMEYYTAFTACGGKQRYFRVWHEPWPQTRVDVTIEDGGLLEKAFPWFRGARLAGANYSPGVRDVRIGFPHSIKGQPEKRHG